MSRRRISVAGIQFLHQQGRREANLQRAGEMICANGGHDLYVLPELACSGYGPAAFAQLDELAEQDDGPSFQAFSQLARAQRCFICYSFPRRQPRGKPTISAAVVDRAGKLVVTYDKWHVCQFGACSEKDYFDVGHTPPAVFEIDGIRVGICICYDIRFPELMRRLAVGRGRRVGDPPRRLAARRGVQHLAHLRGHPRH